MNTHLFVVPSLGRTLTKLWMSERRSAHDRRGATVATKSRERRARRARARRNGAGSPRRRTRTRQTKGDVSKTWPLLFWVLYLTIYLKCTLHCTALLLLRPTLRSLGSARREANSEIRPNEGVSEWEDVSEYVWAQQAAGQREYPRIPERPLVTDCRSYGECLSAKKVPRHANYKWVTFFYWSTHHPTSHIRALSW